MCDLKIASPNARYFLIDLFINFRYGWKLIVVDQGSTKMCGTGTIF